MDHEQIIEQVRDANRKELARRLAARGSPIGYRYLTHLVSGTIRHPFQRLGAEHVEALREVLMELTKTPTQGNA
jgi:hypothetical protein